MKLLFKLFIVALFITGCTNQKDLDITKQFPNINMSKNVSSDFKVLTLRDRFRSDNMMEVEVNILNNLHYSKEVGYKVIWLDSDGFEIKTIMSRWIYKKIDGNRKLTISSISPSKRAVDYRINIDYADQIKENKIQ